MIVYIIVVISIFHFRISWSAMHTAHRDAALREVVQPPISSEQQHDERDPDPCPPEDEVCFDAPDAASMEEAISKFVEGLESQEHSGFDDIHRLLKSLPVPVAKAIRLMTHARIRQSKLNSYL